MFPVQVKRLNVEVPLSEMIEIESNYYQALDRFNHVIRDAEITLRDTNGPKGGLDKLCIIQLRFHPRGLAVVKSIAASFPQAASSACDKMQQVASKRLERRKSARTKNSRMSLEGGESYVN